jgi:hypothetical protein
MDAVESPKCTGCLRCEREDADAVRTCRRIVPDLVGHVAVSADAESSTREVPLSIDGAGADADRPAEMVPLVMLVVGWRAVWL